MHIFQFVTLLIALISCALGGQDARSEVNMSDHINDSEEPVVSNFFYYGADLSYVNEMLDCGAVFKDNADVTKDPYTIFSEAGTNLVRVRLWHNPTWTLYSNYTDVKRTIARAKEEGMAVLLDFHYSDTWADPAKQIIPEAWKSELNNTESLGELLYEYTYAVLQNLANEGLLPEMVQVGNEINQMILQEEEQKPMDWARNAYLINKGIQAVRAVSKETKQEIGVMLHIAQPENALWWFEQAGENGVEDYDWIGLSYYPLWSDYTLSNVGDAFKKLISTYKKRLMVVETAYPFTMVNNDPANNILDEKALISGYPATQQGQLDYLKSLQRTIENAGGEGLVYWEPAWVSTGCSTLWGEGSHWDNATLFDHDNKAHLGMTFYNAALK